MVEDKTMSMTEINVNKRDNLTRDQTKIDKLMIEGKKMSMTEIEVN
jgi:hypothetical protein